MFVIKSTNAHNDQHIILENDIVVPHPGGTPTYYYIDVNVWTDNQFACKPFSTQQDALDFVATLDDQFTYDVEEV